jgi:hypothetical protein
VQTDWFNWYWIEPLNFKVFGSIFRFKNINSVDNFNWFSFYSNKRSYIRICRPHMKPHIFVHISTSSHSNNRTHIYIHDSYEPHFKSSVHVCSVPIKKCTIVQCPSSLMGTHTHGNNNGYTKMIVHLYHGNMMRILFFPFQVVGIYTHRLIFNLV